LWDTASGRELSVLKGQSTMIRSLAFSPDGKRVVAAGMDNRFRLWDVTTGQELIAFRGGPYIQCVAFSPDGRTIATGESFGWVRFRHATSPEEVLKEARPSPGRGDSRSAR
jgi:WD40 repeat protein